MFGFGFGVVQAARRLSPYDFIIQSDADWTNGKFLALQSSGGSVGVAPGTYTAKTLPSISPATPLVIEATNPNNPPVINKLTVNNLKDVTLRNLKIVSDSWQFAPQDALTFNNSVITGTVDFDGLVFRGNYRHDYGAYDTYDFVTNDVPEYACIHGTIAGGTVTSLTVFNDYVGDLVPDGTGIPLSLTGNAGSGTGFSATISVSGGRFVPASLNLISGGSGYTDTGTNNSPYGIVTWAGRAPFIDRVPSGAGGQWRVNVGATVYVRNCHFGMVGNGFKLGASLSGGVAMSGSLFHWNNTYDGYYMDGFSISLKGSTAPQNVSHMWNKFTRQFCKVGDANDPHGDPLQHFLSEPTGSFIPRIELIGNEALNAVGVCRSTEGQFIFMADPGDQAYELHAVGNAGMLLATNGLIAEIGSNCFIYGNTVVPGKPADPGHTSPINIYISNNPSSPAYGQSWLSNNIAERVFTGAVRRQNIWHNSRRKLAECGPRLGVDVKRQACGVASADARWSAV